MALRHLAAVIGVALAGAIAFGRIPFGLQGERWLWFAIGIALPYAVLAVLTWQRVGVAIRRGRTIKRAVWVLQPLAWVSALGFALTVPDEVAGESGSIIAPIGADPVLLEMSVALCNPFAVIALFLMGCAWGFAFASGLEPRTEDDDYGGQMMPHPLA